jgi:Ca-activated chloride channel family protein
MHCEKAEMLLAQVVFGEPFDFAHGPERAERVEGLNAAGGEGAELAAHLAGCKACAELLNDMRVAAGLLREGLLSGPAPVLSPERRAALLAKAAEIRAERMADGRRAGAAANRSRILGWTAAAAAALLLAAVLLPAWMSASRSCLDAQGPAPKCPAPTPADGPASAGQTALAIPGGVLNGEGGAAERTWGWREGGGRKRTEPSKTKEEGEVGAGGLAGVFSRRKPEDSRRDVFSNPRPVVIMKPPAPSPAQPPASFQDPYHGPYRGPETREQIAKHEEERTKLKLSDELRTRWAVNGVLMAAEKNGPRSSLNKLRQDEAGRQAPPTRDLSRERDELVRATPPPPPPPDRSDPIRRSRILSEPTKPAGPAEKPPADPSVTHEDKKLDDHFETKEVDTRTTRSMENPIADIPLGGTGTAGPVRVGGSAPAGKDRESGEFRKTVKAMIDRAQLYDRNGKCEESRLICEQVLKLDPGNSKASSLLASTKEKAHRAKEAESYQAARIERPSTMQNMESELHGEKDRENLSAARLTSPHALAALDLIGGRKPQGKAKAPPAGEEQPVRAPFIVLTPEQVKTVEKAPETQTRLPEPTVEKPAVGPEAEPEPAANSGAVFKVVPVNPFVMAAQDRFSTFALDVDTASYAIARRYLRGGHLPPVGSVRMEEYVNAFDYNYPRRTEGTFTVISEAAAAPFGPDLVLLKVGVRARVVGREGRKPAHLVFVVDASGSMDQPDRMPLVKYALGELVGQLSAADRVTLVAYGTRARLMLEAASAADKAGITAAVNRVQCEGSTNLSEGLTLGYRLAAQGFLPGGVNRVILCSDGAANIGITAAESILDQVKGFRDQGITCTSVGFGAGTYNDALLEKLADSGDGSYVFVDSRREARRIFVEELSATLQTVAKDAKIQVEFDPRRVRRYRLIGYENRDIADEKFRDDTVDAGEVGSGQSATALYELELQGLAEADLGTVYVRYRNVDTGRVEEISHRLEAAAVRTRTPETDPRFFLAACAAEFAELLRESEHTAGGSFDQLRSVLERVAAQPALRNNSRVQELLELVRLAKGLPRAN